MNEPISKPLPNSGDSSGALQAQNLEQMNNFLHNIAWIRKHYKLSKAKMAQQLEISVQTLDKIEKGIVPPRLSVKVFFLVQKQFGIHPRDQLGERFGE